MQRCKIDAFLNIILKNLLFSVGVTFHILPNTSFLKQNIAPMWCLENKLRNKT